MNRSSRPVMTFEIAGEWLAVPVEKMERIAFTERLWPVPLSRPEHIGLLEDGEDLIPVLTLDDSAQERAAAERGGLVAILHVRGESVALSADSVGRIYNDYQLSAEQPDSPDALRAYDAQHVEAAGSGMWLIDPDRLWLDSTDGEGLNAPTR